MVYSFLDVQATITGPGGSISLGSGAGVAEEGISVEFDEDATDMTVGADGSPMIGLNPSKMGTVLVRLQKTSPVNEQLAQLYSVQRASSLTFGQNVIRVTNPVTGDEYMCTTVGFTRFPRNDYAKRPGMIEWSFKAGQIDPVLGSGILGLAAAAI